MYSTLLRQFMTAQRSWEVQSLVSQNLSAPLILYSQSLSSSLSMNWLSSFERIDGGLARRRTTRSFFFWSAREPLNNCLYLNLAVPQRPLGNGGASGLIKTIFIVSGSLATCDS